MTVRIPIKEARELAKKYNLSHIIFWALEDSKMQHVVTYGKTTEECSQAADFGNKLKEALGWPESLFDKPARVKRLQEENKALRKRIKDLGFSIRKFK